MLAIFFLMHLVDEFDDICQSYGQIVKIHVYFWGQLHFFYVFAKSGGGMQKIIFSIFHNIYTSQGSKTI